MPNSADCLNTQSSLGRNLTPIPIIETAKAVMGDIDTDFCSDLVANEEMKAKLFFDFVLDGYFHLQKLNDHYGNCFLNPPGDSYTGGSRDERIELEYLLNELEKKKIYNVRSAVEEAEKQVKDYLKSHSHIKKVTAASWYRALYQAWVSGRVKRVVWVLYRGGSFGSMGDIFRDSARCFTMTGAESEVVNGSGRLAFEIVVNGERVPQTSNTQSSIIGFLPARSNPVTEKAIFCENFKQFGVCI